MTRALEGRLSVSSSKLRRACSPESLPFKTTDDLEPLHLGSVVQKRAVDAIDMGLGLHTRGFNVFVLGLADSGKTTTVRRILEARAAHEPVAPDVCYVHDFKFHDRPRPLFVPPGQGARLASALDGLVRELQRTIPRVLTAHAFSMRRSAITNYYHSRFERLRRRLAREARDLGLELRQEGESWVFTPRREGRELTEEEFAGLGRPERTTYEKAMRVLRDRMSDYELLQQRLDKEAEKEILDEERAALGPIVSDAVEERKKRLADLGPEVARFLDRVRENILENHRGFVPRAEDGRVEEACEDDGAEPDLFTDYRVNVLVDHGHDAGAPVVYERNPTLTKLIGYLEHREARGALRTDHTLIRGGALHQAMGGYLLLQANDLLRRPAAWEALKRALRDREVRIEEPEEEGRPRTAGSVRPEPTPLSTKVVLIGSPDAYYTLLATDEDFVRLFKVKAEFEPTMLWNQRNVMRVARFMAQAARQEGHLPLDRTAVARIIEQSARECGEQRRLSTAIAGLLDLVAEADFQARRAGRKVLTGHDVSVAVRERRRRHSVDEDMVLQMIREGTLMVSAGGWVVGQINGIAVYDTGDQDFGVPVRITARTWVGRAGVVNIDREVQLSGQIHDKGTLIMIGLLGERYAQQRPLGLSASITFEQSYDMVEGDSASCAELFALLSSLSGRPIKQGIAVTGSVNQQGEVQPVGGVNEKIEGVYRICKLRGLTGFQGVMIPRRNVQNLMLSDEVVDAVKKKEFHIYAIDHVDEGIELLTDVPAGRRRANGEWEEGSINALVDARLAEMVERLGQLNEEVE